MPDAEGLKDLTGAQYGLLGTVLVAFGAGVTKFGMWVADIIRTKDERLTKLESDRFTLILEEWRADRAAGVEQQKLNAVALKENTIATGQLAESVKQLANQLTPVPEIVRHNNELIADLRRRLDEAHAAGA